MSCSEAISSSSGGVTDVLSDCGKAMIRVVPPTADGLRKRWRKVNVIDSCTNFSIERSRGSNYLTLSLKSRWQHLALSPLAKTSFWMRDHFSHSALFGISPRLTTSFLKSFQN